MVPILKESIRRKLQIKAILAKKNLKQTLL